jgi:hypothetical protein
MSNKIMCMKAALKEVNMLRDLQSARAGGAPKAEVDAVRVG